MATKEQIKTARLAFRDASLPENSINQTWSAAIDAVTAPLLQEIAALKGELKLEDLPPEPERTKLDEWQACYAALFRQMNEAVAKQAPLLKAVRGIVAAWDGITIEYHQKHPLALAPAIAALRPFLPESEAANGN